MLRPEPLPMSPSKAMRNVGPAVALDHPRRHDADDARMPALAGEHEAGVALGIAALLHLRERLVEDALVERLALDVEPLEPPGQLGRLAPDRR